MLIDTHCHLTKNDYDSIDKIVENMDGIIITSGCDDETNIEVLDNISRYNNVFGTLGIHPSEIDKLTENSFKIIEDNINNEKIVALGEIGLDYYWRDDNKEYQKEILRRQLDLAQKYGKPVIIHSREAIQDTYDILKQYNLKGSIHCFSSSLDMAKKFIKLGYKIGVGGTLTFKNSKKIQEIVKNLSLEDIILETDSPYLSPEPLRGKKNVPSNVKFVAEKISQLKNINIDEVINVTNKTAIKLFMENKK